MGDPDVCRPVSDMSSRAQGLTRQKKTFSSGPDGDVISWHAGTKILVKTKRAHDFSGRQGGANIGDTLFTRGSGHSGGNGPPFQSFAADQRKGRGIHGQRGSTSRPRFRGNNFHGRPHPRGGPWNPATEGSGRRSGIRPKGGQFEGGVGNHSWLGGPAPPRDGVGQHG